MIKKSFLIFSQMILQIRRDLMLVLLCITPVLAGAFFKFAIPFGESLLCSYFGKEEILAPFYYILDWLLALLPGIMFAFVGGLVVLGEVDDKIAGYMALTPAGNRGYLLARIGYPSLISVAAGFITIRLFGLSYMENGMVLILCISSAMMGALTAMLVIAISTNKVEGMAIGKLAGLISMGIFIPIVLDGKVQQYLFGILPSFWLGKYLTGGSGAYLFLFAAVYMGWMILMYRRYREKVVKTC